jgi:hypothetical protein
LKSKSKLDLGYLPALTAEVIKGNGQPEDGFLKEPFVGGSSMVQRASTTYSAGSKDIGTVDIAAAKDVSALHLQLVTRAQAKMATKELVPGKELPEPLLDLIAKH